MSDFWDREVVERQHIEWMSLLPVRLHINALIGGGQLQWPIEWFESWLNGRTFERALSIGCGAGALERDLVRRGMCRRVDAFDASIASLHIARDAARSDPIHYYAADFNRCALPGKLYDVVFFHQSAHHVARLEHLFTEILRALKPDGLIYLDEYVGPSRTEWNADRLAPQQAFFDAIPPEIRLTDVVPLPIQQDDPSEAVRSGEIEPLLRVGFDVLARRPYGGTLLAVLLPNMKLSEVDAVLPYCIGCERALLAAGMPSYYAVIVARPKRRLRKTLALIRYAARASRRRRLPGRPAP